MRNSGSTEILKENHLWLKRLLGQYGWLMRLRPQVLANPLIKLLAPYDHRRIIDCAGLQLYVDAFSHLGRTLLEHGIYEPEVVEIFEREIKPGDIVLDVGANEGFFAAKAARLVGSKGVVIAVEPQSRLYDILAVNLALNASGRTAIYQNAIDLNSGGTVRLSLTPLSNTGATSIVHRYRWSRATEQVKTISIDKIIERESLSSVDFVKIDVEGYEYEVLNSMSDSLHIIKKIFVDYHGQILKERGLSVLNIHRHLRSIGFVETHVFGQAVTEDTSGYVLYEKPG